MTSSIFFLNRLKRSLPVTSVRKKWPIAECRKEVGSQCTIYETKITKANCIHRFNRFWRKFFLQQSGNIQLYLSTYSKILVKASSTSIAGLIIFFETLHICLQARNNLNCNHNTKHNYSNIYASMFMCRF